MWHVNPLPDMQGCPARQRTSGSVITFNCMNTAVCRRASWARSVPKPPPEPHKATGLPCIGAGPSTRGLEAQSSAFCNNTAPTKRCQMGFMRCGGCVRSNEPSWVRSWSSYLREGHTRNERLATRGKGPLDVRVGSRAGLVRTLRNGKDVRVCATESLAEFQHAFRGSISGVQVWGSRAYQ